MQLIKLVLFTWHVIGLIMRLALIGTSTLLLALDWLNSVKSR